MVGKNGSGKSVLLRAWRDSIPDTVHYVAPERTGEMTFAPHLLQQEMEADGRRASSTRNFVPDYRQRIVGRIQAYFMTRGNHRGEGAPAGDPPEVERFLETLIPDFSVHFNPGTTPYELTRVATSESVTQIDQLSSGEAQLLTIGLDILTIAAIWDLKSQPRRLLLIDEPDAHIHPDLQARFADFILRVSEKYSVQFVVATHSPSLLSALGQFGGARTSVVYLQRNQSSYRARPFDAVTKELAACLGGHVLMGPLFGAPLLLVEGDDDYRIWSQVPRHHVLNLAVIPCNGDEIRRYQRSLERILGSLREETSAPVGFALLDGDKSVPMENADCPQRSIRYLGLKCHEVENLYLTDEVLQLLKTTWAFASDRIVAESADFGAHSALAARAASWDRANEDIKPIIAMIATKLDAKGVPWTQRVGTALGRSRPSGQLAAFLGESVVQSLWGPSSAA